MTNFTFARDLGNAVIADSIGTMVGNALLGLGANGALLLGSYWIARHGFKQPRGLPAVLATAVVFWVACTLGLEVLGVFGALSLGPMLAWGLMVGAIGGVLRWFRAEVDPDLQLLERDEPLSWDAMVSLALLLSAAARTGDEIAASGCEGGQRRAHLSSLLRGAVVEGRTAVSGRQSVWRECGHLFPRQWRSLVYLADGDVGRGSAGQGRSSSVPAFWPRWRRLGVRAGWGRVGRPAWSRRAGSLRRRRCLLFSFEPNVDTIFVAGYLMAAYFFLRASRAARGDTAALLSRGTGGGGGARNQGRRGRLCSSAPRSGGGGGSGPGGPGSNQDRADVS